MDSGPRTPARQRHPAVIALVAGLAVVVAAFVPVLWSMWQTPGAPARTVGTPPAGTPWAIENASRDAIRVFGLDLPGATLADAQAAWSDDFQIALMATRGEPAVLEALVDSARPAGVSGRLLFTADVPAAVLQRWRDRATREEPVSADTRRITLRSEDRAEALGAPLVGIGFIPAVQLDSATLRLRFGEPAQVLRTGGSVEHWLYPDKGLAIALDADGRELLQYVAPADFARRLRAPLLSPASTARPASGPPG